MIQIILCEDDEKQAIHLKQLLDAQLGSAKKLTVFTSGHQLLKELFSIEDGSIFLMDIVLDDISGIEIAQTINQQLPHSVIIFISAYLEKATEVYDANHCYFVFKAELEHRLPMAIERALSIINSAKQIVPVTLKSKTICLPSADILYLERIRRVTVLHTKTGIYEVPQNFDFFQDYLPASFYQCHRSFIVNLHEVATYHRTFFTLHNLAEIPISRSYAKKTAHRFQSFLMKKI